MTAVEIPAIIIEAWWRYLLATADTADMRLSDFDDARVLRAEQVKVGRTNRILIETEDAERNIAIWRFQPNQLVKIRFIPGRNK